MVKGVHRTDHPAHVLPVFTQHPRPHIRIVLADRQAVIVRCRVEHADSVTELLQLEELGYFGKGEIGLGEDVLLHEVAQGADVK